ncbi:hypothetical protein M9H77_21526 [Catharanthus roseus]|uniref:Uncharacterized protein n=1 Tax=Catharanthus roseus TaxID=4058 RepID=A0ACC0AML0_CATRO|nr:hypothetical protein M9H77_21526 [Catharanthus roseus]
MLRLLLINQAKKNQIFRILFQSLVCLFSPLRSGCHRYASTAPRRRRIRKGKFPKNIKKEIQPKGSTPRSLPPSSPKYFPELDCLETLIELKRYKPSSVDLGSIFFD